MYVCIVDCILIRAQATTEICMLFRAIARFRFFAHDLLIYESGM